MYVLKMSPHLVCLARSNARNSVRMLSEPFSHPGVGPRPLERVGVVLVVLRPGGRHVRDELLPAAPRHAPQVAIAERLVPQLGLVEPRGMHGREAGPPPRTVFPEVVRRRAGRVAGITVLDQEHSSQASVAPAKRPQLTDVVLGVF